MSLARKIITAVSVLLLSASPLVARVTACQNTWVTEFGVRALMRNHRGGAGAFVFQPIKQDQRSFYFTQADLGRFQDIFSMSIGGGYRQMEGRDWAWGVNAFGDYGYSDNQHSYFQLGIGAELFSCCWMARVNGYFPIHQKHLENKDVELLAKLGQPVNPPPGVEILDASFDLCDFERTYTGFDVQVGAMIDLGPAELWGFVKGFYFDACGVEPIAGPEFTIMYRTKPLPGWGAELYFGAEWEWDRLRNGNGAAFAGLRIPLKTWNYTLCGGNRTGPWDCWNCLQRHMNWNVWRHPAIYTELETTRIARPMNVIGLAVFADAVGGGTGTQADPTTLAAALAVNPDLVFLLGDEGAMTGNITMLDGQTVAGFASQSTVQVPVIGGRILTINALNATAPLAQLNAGAGVGITLASDTTVQGIGIFNASTAILGTGVGNVTIDNVFITAPVATVGIGLTSLTGTNTIRNAFIDSAPIGISVTQAADIGTYLITGNQITNATTGLHLETSGTTTGNFLVQSNTLETTTTGIEIIQAGASALNGRLLDNTLTLFTNVGILADHAGGDTRLLISGNAFDQGAGPALDAQFTGAGGEMSLIVRNNTDTGGNDALSPYIFVQNAASGTQCVSFTGNDTDRTTNEVIFDKTGAATLEVENLNDIAQDNNGIVAVTPNPGVTSVDSGTCPFPPSIP